jgi:hypothetical protein
MRIPIPAALLLAAALSVLAAGLPADAAEPELKPGDALPEARTEPRAGKAVRDIEWLDLIPEADRKAASLAPPTPMHDYLGGEGGPAASQPMQYSINQELDGQRVRLPGFVVPLELDAKGEIIEMFLVPYFGACIHVPPPAPNQIVHVKLKEGLKADSMYAAFWITGPLKVARTSTRLGASTYSIEAERIEEYQF